MRASYTGGEAWCVVHGDRLVVLDRGLDAAGAVAIHAGSPSAASLRDDPLALAVLEPVDEGWLLWRRRGVPAVGAEPLPERTGEAWGSDLLPTGSTVAFGAVGALADALPVEGGVVRASAVRVELVAGATDASPRAEVDAIPSVDALPEPGLAHETGSDARDASGSEPSADVVEHASEEPAPASAEDVAEPAAPEHAVPVTTFEPPTAPERQPEPEPEQATTHPGIVGIIDSVPGFIRPAAVVEVPDLEVGDHDGMTIAGDAARALAAAAREQAPAAEPPAPALGPATGPVVLSTLCAAGHVNPPGATTCGCGEPIAQGSSDQRARPEFAELVLPDGERVPLGRGVVLGRRPSSRRVEQGRVPRLVTVHSPSEDISRSHLEVRCEDWNVLAIDLDSTNGTVLLRDGAAPMRLRADAPQLVAFGDRLDLGDGVVVRVERAGAEPPR